MLSGIGMERDGMMKSVSAILTSLALLAIALPAAAQGQLQGREQVQLRTRIIEETRAPILPDRFTRARDNIIALRDGRLLIGDLNAEELQDVIDFDRRMRGDHLDNRSARERCIDDEVRREGGAPSRLAWEVIRLKCRD